MRAKNGKKAASVLVAVTMLSTVLAACSDNNGNKEGGASNSPSTTASETSKPAGEKSKVSVWYLWGGAEGEALEQIIKDFNASQDKYVVEGLSVPDEQKIKVAIAGGKGPDLTDSFDFVVPQYAQQGIALPLDDLIARDGYDVSDFVPAALSSGNFDGKQYALPLNVNFSVMYYNKKLLSDAGFAEPPKTSAELYDVIVKTTKVNDNGTIDVLGSPSYPSEAYLFNALAYGFGSTYVNEDASALTFNNEGTVAAMNMIRDYNTKFGVDNIRQIQASGKWLDPTDPFLTGKQAIRFDGPWLSATIKSKQIDIDYGIAALPYLEGKPETAGSGLTGSSIFYIAKTSKNVDGAWEFMKYLYSAEPLAKFLSLMGNVPATKSAMASPAMKDMVDSDLVIPLTESPNLKSIPHFAKRSDFDKALGEELELMYNLKKTPEETMTKLESVLSATLK
ncbi:ABC transporter substrate-binding protein [Cohnella herbarum]|uniref:ABC transporter substrate-binding protein n=1 Tax=Cohnella herbarum TaxID=2728023 RepID=A0A7Z2VML1_9BACL|nr:ABC transporter substrate-binding protein [Cohnella herbarum]QJD86043.1 ABC transporter substrate-binding protein [Cohnella herbarum]